MHIIVVSVEALDASFSQHGHGDLLSTVRVGWHVVQQFVAIVFGGVWEEHGRALLLAFKQLLQVHGPSLQHTAIHSLIAMISALMTIMIIVLMRAQFQELCGGI